MLPTHEQISGIDRDRERRFSETEVFVVHANGLVLLRLDTPRYVGI